MLNLVHPADDIDTALTAHLDNENDTLELGAILATALTPGLKIWLNGNLGSGKTTLTRGMLRELGHTEKVKSPTYTLIEPYVVSRLNLYHFDFYRLNSPEEYLDAGLDEYFSGQGVCIVEWPEQAVPYLAAPDLVVLLEPEGDGRRATLRGHTEAGRTCIEQIAKHPITPPPRRGR
ncbi:MAG: tRNA (adenosine(37)-N6)-threonylcarbamoyltransferase complex ATPase subunit type 1 TsaE [Azoarcus sp.]|jgi:tRNA threonylcarbamoyladenosine biosynthesis protein TsaE|nr:tRNA (adenosine(37)-N6)-threonylcarbamoyltransferase complex ATPase subunit type 1 TsaE [Azoarcus sp.]MDD2874292.1 tRNA (adenosine(37)-N6)-threonylcarbamoyltransferase complex ATPase subunit type 1 TsaE [Azoarcus sp.]MDX9838591.1 tRNA (adenosine(37)-N6)-threonylcarbamoyltransferase complex ATPase subunit type 1 TsaE [Azoarcus sp.]